MHLAWIPRLVMGVIKYHAHFPYLFQDIMEWLFRVLWIMIFVWILLPLLSITKGLCYLPRPVVTCRAFLVNLIRYNAWHAPRSSFSLWS